MLITAEAFLTAYGAMFLSARLKKEESILIHAVRP